MDTHVNELSSKSKIARTNIAEQMRQKMGPTVGSDKFTTFTWRGENSWEVYHCFIINNGSDLKWVNYGSISNSYSKTLYETNKTLLGVELGTKSMSLKVGLFAITADEYRKFVYWLDPMAIDRLQLATDLNYFYYAKISSVSEATKYVLGRDENKKELYYAELTIKFDLQGNGYAYSSNPIVLCNFAVEENTPNASNHQIFTSPINFDNLIFNPSKILEEEDISDIRTGLFIDINFFNPQDSISWIDKSLEVRINNSTNSFVLFSFDLNSDIALGGFSLKYDSNTGTIMSQDNLLSLLTRADNGEKMFSNFVSNKFLLPSNFEDRVDINTYKEMSITFTPNTGDANLLEWMSNVKVYYYKKTLVI